MVPAPHNSMNNRPKAFERRFSVLRGSLAGEYAAMLLMFHAGCGMLVWGLAAPASANGLGLVLGLVLVLVLVLGWVWLLVRTTGAFSGRGITPLVTAILAGLVFLVVSRDLGGLPPFLVAGPFSPSVLLAIMTAMFFIDLTDCWLSFRRSG